MSDETKKHPPHPRASPRPNGERAEDLGEEPTTNPGNPVDVGYLKAKLAEYEQTLDDALRHHDNRLTFRSIIVAIAAVAMAVIAALLFIDNRVEAQTTKGVAVEDSRITNLEGQRKSDREENDSRFKRLEEGQLRTDKKLDALLDRLAIPNPAPAPPPTKDGGTK